MENKDNKYKKIIKIRNLKIKWKYKNKYYINLKPSKQKSDTQNININAIE